LAELADLHRNYVGGVERGERNVCLINIVKIARGLNVRPAKLIEPIRLDRDCQPEVNALHCGRQQAYAERKVIGAPPVI
jgi:transcriptional regulator with XRE-family HTH domain